MILQWLDRFRRQIEDTPHRVSFPLHLLPCDYVHLNGRYRMATRSMTLNTMNDLIAFIDAEPQTAPPTRQERGWRR
jgi:hypothetical protein